MKTTLKLLVAGAVLLGMGNVARAVSQVDYYLWIDSPDPITGFATAGKWALSASVTGGAGGLSAFAVNFSNADTGTSVAPRSTNGGVETAGFESGNGFFNVVGGKQAFARQYTSAVYPTPYPPNPALEGLAVDTTTTTIVYGIGAAPVADASFGAPAPNTMVGSAFNDGLPTTAGFQAGLYNGTYTSGAAATRVKFGSFAAVPPSGSANVPVLNAGVGVQTNQPTNAAAVYIAPNLEPVELPTFVYHVVWTPDVNGDGFVGGDDLNAVLGKWGQGVAAFDRANGDLSGDGFVGGDDLNFILGAWGQNLYAGAPGVSPVPEPSAMGLLAIGGLGLMLYRRSKARA